MKNAPGVVVIDDREANHFPTPLEVSNKDDVAVGRIRRDVSQDGDNGYESLWSFCPIFLFPHFQLKTQGFDVCRLDIFVCGDQIRKGAALNAVQIAEMLL